MRPITTTSSLNTATSISLNWTHSCTGLQGNQHGWYRVGTGLVQTTGLVRGWYGVGTGLVQGWYGVGTGLVQGSRVESVTAKEGFWFWYDNTNLRARYH